MSQLVVRLPLPDAAAPGHFAYALSDNGQDVLRHGVAEAALLPCAGVQDVVALVPVQALSWHQVELPKGSTSSVHRLRAVLDGLLEDRLLDEPASLHMALAPGGAVTGRTWVAVCHAGWLRTRLDVLEQAGCAVGRIVPEFHPALLPAEPATHEPALPDAETPVPGAPPDARLLAIAHEDASPCWVRTGSDLADGPHAPGVLVWPLPLPEAATLTETATPPQRMGGATVPPGQIQADPAIAQAAEHWLHQPVAIVPQAQRWLQAAQSPWNLAQMAFANAGSDRLRKRASQGWHRFVHAPQWRAVRWGLLALLLVQLAGLQWWAWRTRAELAARKGEITTLLTSTFPEVQTVIDAPVQMQRQLVQLRQGSGVLTPHDLEARLATTARHLPDARLQGLQWDGSQLRLKGLAVNGAQQSAWQSALEAQGLQARQEGTDWLITPRP